MFNLIGELNSDLLGENIVLQFLVMRDRSAHAVTVRIFGQVLQRREASIKTGETFKSNFYFDVSGVKVGHIS